MTEETPLIKSTLRTAARTINWSYIAVAVAIAMMIAYFILRTAYWTMLDFNPVNAPSPYQWIEMHFYPIALLTALFLISAVLIVLFIFDSPRKRKRRALKKLADTYTDQLVVLNRILTTVSDPNLISHYMERIKEVLAQHAVVEIAMQSL